MLRSRNSLGSVIRTTILATCGLSIVVAQLALSTSAQAAFRFFRRREVAQQLQQPTLAEKPSGELAAAIALAEQRGDNVPPPADPANHVKSVKFEPVPELEWLTDYSQGMRLAKKEGRNLFIYFHEGPQDAARRSFEAKTLADAKIKEALADYILVDLDRNATVETTDHKMVKLLEHPSFAEMLHRQGVAIVDMSHRDAPYYGHVVSTFPFSPGKYYRAESLAVILGLPAGTLTQRTMIYAVRIHPERPASTNGQFLKALADEANNHSIYQASITLQGHHMWDARFDRINSKLPGGAIAKEVVAESWPNEGLVEACVDCVDSWRQSPGHWGAVRSNAPFFGYDIKRGRNGIWYATGIFGNR